MIRGDGICLLSSRSLFLGAAIDVFQAGLALDGDREIGERKGDNDENNGNIKSVSMMIGDSKNYDDEINEKN